MHPAAKKWPLNRSVTIRPPSALCPSFSPVPTRQNCRPSIHNQRFFFLLCDHHYITTAYCRRRPPNRLLRSPPLMNNDCYLEFCAAAPRCRSPGCVRVVFRFAQPLARKLPAFVSQSVARVVVCNFRPTVRHFAFRGIR